MTAETYIACIGHTLVQEVMVLDRFYNAVMLFLVLLILVLLFRVALGIHVQAISFTGELPPDLRF